MKTGIVTIALAGLAVIVFGASDAQSWWFPGPDLSYRLSDSAFVSSSIDGQPTPLDGQPATVAVDGIARSKRSRPGFTAQGVLDEVPQEPSLFPPACLAMGQAGSTISVTTVLIYHDGSLLSLTTDDGSYFCTDGSVFTVDFGGTVSGGEGRFEGATGTWEGTARAEDARLLSEIDIELDG